MSWWRTRMGKIRAEVAHRRLVALGMRARSARRAGGSRRPSGAVGASTASHAAVDPRTWPADAVGLRTARSSMAARRCCLRVAAWTRYRVVPALRDKTLASVVMVLTGAASVRRRADV